ncbi:MAG: hypothetical protein ACI95T_001178 [Flavobacteriales bacterium]
MVFCLKKKFIDMILEEYFTYRKELINQSQDDEGMVSESLFLSQVLPSMLDAKLIDSEDFNSAYFLSKADKMKMNAYCVNHSGERLQLFLIDESSIDLTMKDKNLQVSTKSKYESQFKRGINFLKKAVKGHLNDEIQDSDSSRPLISKVSSSQGVQQFDVFEVFLISATCTVSKMGKTVQPKRIDFEDEEINTSYTFGGERKTKSIVLKKRLIDLNFLYTVLISKGYRDPLEVDFVQLFGNGINAIKAANEKYFESYLCVLPASLLSRLYKEHSTRLLEKNVRSFLQFRGVNQGIRDTIRKEPEKFIAYNNGLTITATKGEVENVNGQSIINSLFDFQIVNGGQTTASIYFTSKDGFDVSKVKVVAKISITKEANEEELEELISKISTYSNAQSRVSKVDLNSRNPQLLKLKSLSDSVLAPSGNKWFFERVKGEFNTAARIAGSNKSRIEKEYPRERRFSKELLAKYYCAWGVEPYLVKKGGEKIFRIFIEELCGEGRFKHSKIIDRPFYEELISKVILFRSLEKIYGQGKNSMGQLRSAVVPYSISILNIHSDGKKRPFDLLKIWLTEKIEDDLREFFRVLLRLTDTLIKQYSASDDYGEYSKKKELWEAIKKSKEIKEFINSDIAQQILEKYTISKEELEERRNKNRKVKSVDFGNLVKMVDIQVRGFNFYETVRLEEESVKINQILASFNSKEDLSESVLDFEVNLIERLRAQNPSLFDKSSSEFLLKDTLNLVLEYYNKALKGETSVLSDFEKLEAIAKHKGKKNYSVFKEIGKMLEEGLPPSLSQIYRASNFFSKDVNQKSVELISESRVDSIEITPELIRKMVEWDLRIKVLSRKENAYLSEFAYGLKWLNDFHRRNTRKYLETLIDKGFTVD